MTTQEAIARALCRASALNPTTCPFCDKAGQCSGEMWPTFMREAAAVIATLTYRGELKVAPRKAMLPGLGG